VKFIEALKELDFSGQGDPCRKTVHLKLILFENLDKLDF
jgi:hypothetical protein